MECKNIDPGVHLGHFERWYNMNILCACEESQAVTIELRKLGHKAFSCDIQECSGGHPEWHIQDDVLNHLVGWDMIIAFPPCTYLTVTGNRWFNVDKYGQKAIERMEERKKAIQFFMALAKAPCDKIAIENPVGIMSTEYAKPTQIIHPYYFGDPARKKTCLWLKGLQPLKPTNIVEPKLVSYKCKNGKIATFSADYGAGGRNNGKRRSKTYKGVAKAMAEQWTKGV